LEYFFVGLSLRDGGVVFLCSLFMNSVTGKYLIIAGGLLLLAGVIIYFFHDKLHWIGRLPGDIRVEKENFRFYFPITTMILLSLLITALLAVIRRFF
jgi:hypothetical protein